MEYKGYNLEQLGTFPMVKVKAKGQGRVPKALNGLFTTKSEATKAVDMYLNSLLTKGRKNAKADSTSTG